MNHKVYRCTCAALLACAIGAMAPWRATQMNTKVFAQDGERTGEKSAITLVPGEGGTLAGRTFSFFRVLDAQPSADGASIRYTFNPQTKTALCQAIGEMQSKTPDTISEIDAVEYLASLKSAAEGAPENSTSQFRRFVEVLRKKLRTSGTPQLEKTVNEGALAANGSLSISDLPYGWYLVDEGALPAGAQAQAASLCLVDTLSDAQGIRLELKNDMPLLTKKIHEDDGEIGWNDIGDYEAGQKVPYALETTVPQISGYSSYYLGFHDKFDAGLKFHPSSLCVTLSGGDKTITLSDNDYQLVHTEGSHQFEVRIPDIKALADRHFPEERADGTRPYGQIVRVAFDAEITTEAFKEGGGANPLENSARLEFSNDPRTDMGGSHGFTPWDSVVCFSYTLDVLKTNEKDTPLESAQFRLYTDEACTNEVLARPGLDGYIVISADALAADPSLSAQAAPLSSKSDGTFRLYGLDQGTYFLKEVKAPDGYTPLQKPIMLSISPTFMEDRNGYEQGFKDISQKVLKALEATASITDRYLGQEQTVRKDLETAIAPPKIALSVVNRTGMKLPLTGSAGALLSLGAGGVLVVLGLGCRGKGKSRGDARRKTGK